MNDRTKHAATLAAVLTTEAAEFAAKVRSRKFKPMPHPKVIAADTLALIRIGKGVARWAVRACNGEGRQVWVEDSRPHSQLISGRFQWRWGDADDAAKERADERAIAKLQAIADRYGATVKLGGDPRGYVVKLKLASGRHNTWGGAADGWGVA